MYSSESSIHDLPLVSMLMTAYNQEKYISDSIESVLELLYPNWELIITDDCSTDRTFAICDEYAKKDSRIRVFRNDKNLGDYNNRNKAASYANGKYLKYLDSDDIIYPYGLCAMVYAMERFPKAGFGLSYSVIDDIRPYPQFVESKLIIKNEYLDKSLLGVGPSASIIRKDVFFEVGGFSGEQFLGDTELWLRIASCYPMVKLAPALNWYRRHPNQQINLEKRNTSIVVKRFLLSKRVLERNKDLFSSDELNFAYKRLYRNFSRMNLKQFLLKLNVVEYGKICKQSGLTFIQMAEGLKPYIHGYND